MRAFHKKISIVLLVSSLLYWGCRTSFLDICLSSLDSTELQESVAIPTCHGTVSQTTRPERPATAPQEDCGCPLVYQDLIPPVFKSSSGSISLLPLDFLDSSFLNGITHAPLQSLPSQLAFLLTYTPHLEFDRGDNTLNSLATIVLLN